MAKTLRCIVANCDHNATKWDGFIIKSRDRVLAGLCDVHWGVKPKNVFGKKN